jgi:hypothetical protein
MINKQYISLKVKKDFSNEYYTEFIVKGLDQFGKEITETVLVPKNGDVVTTENYFTATCR